MFFELFKKLAKNQNQCFQSFFSLKNKINICL
eukprot:UN01959